MPHVRRIDRCRSDAAAQPAAPRRRRRMPADMDIDFVRGCWVQKDAPGGQIDSASSACLPDGDNLAGQIADVSTGDWITVADILLQRARASARRSTPATCRNCPRTRGSIHPGSPPASTGRAPRPGGKLAAYAGPARLAQLPVRRRRRRHAGDLGGQRRCRTPRWSSPCSTANATAAIDRISSIAFRAILTILLLAFRRIHCPDSAHDQHFRPHRARRRRAARLDDGQCAAQALRRLPRHRRARRACLRLLGAPQEEARRRRRLFDEGRAARREGHQAAVARRASPRCSAECDATPVDGDLRASTSTISTPRTRSPTSARSPRAPSSSPRPACCAGRCWKRAPARW